MKQQCQILTFLILLFICNPVFSQIQNRNWYFGYGVGIDFGSGLNSPISQYGPLSNGEGVASMSDIGGNLLFCTNGIKVWDKNLTEVASHLKGHSSSTQSAIIVPAPGSCGDLYYIFTVDYYNSGSTSSEGLHYVTVEVNSAGDVVNVSPSTQIRANCVEKVTAVPHANGNDYWILSTIRNTNDITVHRLNDAGIVSNSIQTFVSLPSQVAHFGYIKPSHDANKVAMANNSYLVLFDFDNSTGILTVDNTWNSTGIYGAEFSPNNNILYTSSISDGLIYLHDLSSGSLIPTSSVSIPKFDPTANYSTGALQLGPDGIIYAADFLAPWVGALTDPDNLTLTYSPQYINFSSGTSSLGLPSLINRYQFCIGLGDFTYQDTCQGASVFFSEDLYYSPSSYSWDFGDPSTTADVATGPSASYTYNSPGVYTVRLETEINGIVDVTEKEIEILGDFVELGKDQVICPEEQIELRNIQGESDDNYTWSEGSTTETILVDEAGVYSTTVERGGCVESDEVRITAPINMKLAVDSISLCQGEEYVLKSPEGFQLYQWSTGSFEPQIKINNTGSYSLDVVDENGCEFSDTVFADFEGCSLYIPNAFTPNGDGKNEVFTVVSENIERYNLEIFNRWGKLLISIDENSGGWDGMYAGKIVQSGVYVYKLQGYNEKKGRNIHRQGSVMVLSSDW